MKRVFESISTVSAIIMLSRYVGFEFVSNHYWWFVAIFFSGLAGQVMISLGEKRKNQE